MENQDNFSRPTADLFSTAVVRAAQGWKKIPQRGAANTGGPLSGRAEATSSKPADVKMKQSQQQGHGLSSILTETVTVGAGLTGVPGPVANIASLANLASPTLNLMSKSEKELLQERVFAARMMGAQVTVASNICLSDGTSSSSVYRLDSQPKTTQETPLVLPPEKQAQARLIAAALFNSIKPVLPLTNETLRTASQTHQHQQHQRQLQQTQIILQQQQDQQDQQQQQKQRQVEPPALEVLKKLLKPLEQKLPQQQCQAKSQAQEQLKQQEQQHQPPGSTAGLNLAGKTQTQKWSNKSQNIGISKFGNSYIQNNSGKPTNSTSNYPAKIGPEIALVAHRQSPKVIPEIPTVVLQRQAIMTKTTNYAGSAENSFSTQNSTPFRSGSTGTIELQNQGLKLLGKTMTPLSVELPKTQSFEVLQSLKADGYIDSPNRDKICKNASNSKNSMIDNNSTIWPSTLEEEWKCPQPVPNPKDFKSRKSSTPSSASKSSKNTDKVAGRKTFKPQPSSQSSQSFLKATDRPTGASKSTWDASVDAFLQSTKRGSDAERKSSEDSGRLHPLQMLSIPAPAVSPVNTGLFSSAAAAEIPFLSEVETDETISSIDRRVEMLKQQKAQILQDQMEEFCKEINVFDGGTADSGPAAKQRKLMSRDKERGGTRSLERERPRLDDRRSDKDRDRYDDRDRDKGRDKRRVDDRDRRTGSPPRKRLSREMEEMGSKSQSHHWETDKKREDYNSPPSPESLRSKSLERNKKDQASSKDAPKELDKRQGRYPSYEQPASSERRTSHSPERKRKRPELKTGEVFIDGRWQRSAVKTSLSSTRQDNPPSGNESKTKDSEMKKLNSDMSKEQDKKEKNTDTSLNETDKDTNSTPSKKITDQKEKGKNDTSKTTKKDTAMPTQTDTEMQTNDMPKKTTEKMEKENATPTKTKKGSDVRTMTAEKGKNTTPSKISERDMKERDMKEREKNSTPSKTTEKKEKESTAPSCKTEKEAAFSAKEKSHADSTCTAAVPSKSQQSKHTGDTKPDMMTEQEILSHPVDPAVCLASKSSKMAAAGSSTTSQSSSLTSSSSIPPSAKALVARDKTLHVESSKSTLQASAASSSSATSTTSPSHQRLTVDGSKQSITAVDNSTAPKPLAMTSTAAKSKRSTSQPTSESGSEGEKIKKRKIEETEPNVEETGQVAAKVKESSLTGGIMERSIPHQMGLLEALSIEQYVQDKVMVDWFCYVCGSICHSWKVYSSHIGGRKHNSRYDRLLKASWEVLEKELISKLKLLPKKGSDPAALAKMGSSLLGPSLGQVSKQNVPTSPSAGSGQGSFCSRCFRNYSCSHEEHLRSEEHKNCEGIRPRCSPCNLIFQKITLYRKHLTTPAHKKKVAAQGKCAIKETDKPSVDDNMNNTDTEKSESPQQKSIAIGSEFITPISGFFCKLCSKFYNNEKTARDVHCASSLHVAKTKMSTQIKSGDSISSSTERRKRVLIYGHSFPAHLLTRVQSSGETVEGILNLDSGEFDITVIGHPGLTYAHVFCNSSHYVGEIVSQSVDLLILDMGSNDLCSQTGSPASVVKDTVNFLKLVCAGANKPKQIRILSVIQRSKIDTVGQVTAGTFNHRARRFNSQLAIALDSVFPDVKLCAQTKINLPKYLNDDGFHFNDEGTTKYYRGLRWIIIGCKKFM